MHKSNFRMGLKIQKNTNLPQPKPEECDDNFFFSDEEPPKVVSCPSDIYQISDTPKAVSWIEPTFSDNVGVINVENQYKSGDVFQFVPTKVEYRAFDAAGKSAKCEFTVTLKRKFCLICSE